MAKNRKKILILGSSGSVGSCAVDVITATPELFYAHTIVAMGNNPKKLAQQAINLRTKNVAIYDRQQKQALEVLLHGTNIKIHCGLDAILDLAKDEFDITIAAISGIAGLETIMAAIPNSHRVAIANKESIICAQHFLFQHAKLYNTEILPIDSEHSALFQLLTETQNADSANIKKLILTASGGPFLYLNPEELSAVTPEQACKHPIWSMGRKISIDSATLMNKGIEIIEASQLFNIPIDKIDVVVHPESVVHGMIECIDGTILAQLSAHDMKIAVAFALSYPKRLPAAKFSPSMLDITKCGQCSFLKSDVVDKFKTLSIAYQAAKSGHAAVIAMNAGNECAVDAFLKYKIRFTQIPQIIEHCISKFLNNKIRSIYDVQALHDEVKTHVMQDLNIF